MSLFSVLGLIAQIGVAAAARCFECGYGIPMDLMRFGTAFPGFRIHSRPDAPYQRWCTRKPNESDQMTSTLLDCDGACGLVRSSDELSVVVGCLTSIDNITAAHLEVRFPRYGYELIVCDADECNRDAETALLSYKQRKFVTDEEEANDDPQTSAATGRQIFAVTFGLMIGLIKYL